MKKMEKKYIPLAEFFQNSTQNGITLSYDAIENIMGQELPNAAYLNLSWWKKTKPPLTHYLAWLNAEYSVIDVKLGRTVTFSKLQQNASNFNIDEEQKYTYIIRSMESDDARAFINLQEQIFSECNHEYFGADEQHLTVQHVRKMLGEWRKTKKSNVLLCLLNGQFAGYLAISGNAASRISHVASIRLGVPKQYQGLGVGTALLNHAEKWCENHGISKLEAQIALHNEQTKHLFEKQQFACEGTRKGAFLLEDQLVDELSYGKSLN